MQIIKIARRGVTKNVAYLPPMTFLNGTALSAVPIKMLIFCINCSNLLVTLKLTDTGTRKKTVFPTYYCGEITIFPTY